MRQGVIVIMLPLYAAKSLSILNIKVPLFCPGVDLGRGCRGCAPPPREMTCGFLIQPPQKTMWFIGVEVEQETSAPPPKKNPGSAPAVSLKELDIMAKKSVL